MPPMKDVERPFRCFEEDCFLEGGKGGFMQKIPGTGLGSTIVCGGGRDPELLLS